MSNETGLSVWDEETNDGEGDDIEESDTPEHLLDGGGERFARVCSFRGSETDKFSTGEGEGSGDKNRADTLEASSEGAWVPPVNSTDVASLWPTTAVDDYTEDAV